MKFEQMSSTYLEDFSLLLGMPDHCAPMTAREAVLSTANLYALNTLPMQAKGLVNPEYLEKHWSVKTSFANEPEVRPYINLLFGLVRDLGLNADDEAFLHNLDRITPLQIREQESDSLVLLVPPSDVLRREGVTVNGVDIYEGNTRLYMPTQNKDYYNQNGINVFGPTHQSHYPAYVVHFSMLNPRREVPTEEAFQFTISPEFAPPEVLNKYNVLSQGQIDPNSTDIQRFDYV